MIWFIFLLFITSMVALDLGIFNKKDHIISIKEATIWTTIWITLSLIFSIFIYFAYENQWFELNSSGTLVSGKRAALNFLTGYILEKSLSIDNVFVIAMIFSFLGIPARFQHRVLFWGILSAMILRGLMIGIGATLILRYHWIMYIFGFFLIFTAIKMLISQKKDDPAENFFLKLLKRFIPITNKIHDRHFIIKIDKKTFLTPLGVALVFIECTDLVFALDSIPAIFAITTDPFLVFSSNILAIMGLRSLYFVLANMIEKFNFLKLSLAIILGIIGTKMIMEQKLKSIFGEEFDFYILAIIFIILFFGIIASRFSKEKNE